MKFKKNEQTLALKVGFDLNKAKSIEVELKGQNKSYGNETLNLYLDGLEEQALNTSFSDLQMILTKLSEMHGSGPLTICDIGASCCKMAFLAEHFYPNIRVISVEPVSERISYAQEALENSKHIFINDYFKEDDIYDSVDYFFLYFPVSEALETIIESLSKPVIAIEAHGQLINRLSHAFAKRTELTKLIMPRHNPMSYLFNVRQDSNEINALKQLESSSSDLILINDNRPWYADKEGQKAYFDEEEKITIELQNPPRTIYFSDELETIKSSELDTNIQEIISMRREGKKVDGCFIRKIFVDGSFELSSGEIRK